MSPSADKYVRILWEKDSFEVALLEGMESASLSHAVAARAGLPTNAFYLTATPDKSGRLMPLSTALPSGMELTMHSTKPLNVMDLVTPSHTRQSTPSHSRQSTQSEDLSVTCELNREEPTQLKPSPSQLNENPAGEKAGRVSPRTPPLEVVSRENSGHITLKTPLLEGGGVGGSKVGRGKLRRTSSINKLVEIGRVMTFRKPAGEEIVNAAGVESAEMCSTMERFSRISSDLANERTLLAWVRTCLAAMRTVFAFLVLRIIHGAPNYEHWSLLATRMAIASLVVVCALCGVHRYYQLKEVLMQKNPRGVYGRMSLRIFTSVVVAVSLTTAVGIYSEEWTH